MSSDNNLVLVCIKFYCYRQQCLKYLFEHSSIARHIQKHQQLFAVVETLDTGRAVREARDTDVPQVVRIFYHYAGLAQLCDTELQGFKPYGRKF